MERIESIVTGANEVVNKIYEKISEIDNCKAVLANLDGADISLITSTGEPTDLDLALSAEQRAELLYSIRSTVKGNIERAAAFLESVSGAPATEPAPVIPEKIVVSKEEAEEILKPAPEPEPVVPAAVKKYAPRQSKMTVEDVAQMLRDGYGTADIAMKYGYKTTATVENFIKKHKLSVKNLTQGNEKARQLTEKDIPQIRALYTNGPMNLTETAAELGTTKKILREFVEKNHLVKPVR